MAASNVSCSTQTSGNAWRLRHFEGILFGDTFDESRIRSAIQYEPRAGDVFVVGFPKTGTTWLHFTVRHLLNKDDETPLESAAACMPRVSFLEIAGAENVESQRRPGAVIKTHLPFENVRFSEKARYIYVLRNPYDTCVSYYHHMRRNSSDLSDMSFDDFFDQFIDGYVHPNDYFDHLTSWLAQTSKANFLFITYEDMIRDPRSSILKIAGLSRQKARNDSEQGRWLRWMHSCSGIEGSCTTIYGSHHAYSGPGYTSAPGHLFASAIRLKVPERTYVSTT
ncbi:hypothetical protein HPB49_017150 [Dermacentor silvarum]|uniref:Uncharacterized protein n=1 Tax=Dermacentor silvarum TaxID=543639 RepID=A0ACB8CYQ6_DERSI|nr:hypothetical protein HPB49_017150 [Dermacentor silvarum]